MYQHLLALLPRSLLLFIITHSIFLPSFFLRHIKTCTNTMFELKQSCRRRFSFFSKHSEFVKHQRARKNATPCETDNSSKVFFVRETPSQPQTETETEIQNEDNSKTTGRHQR